MEEFGRMVDTIGQNNKEFPAYAIALLKNFQRSEVGGQKSEEPVFSDF
jgi:hypothetical protein